MATIAAPSTLAASSNTMLGLLPPSSRVTLVIRSAEAARIRWPTPRLPVKVTLSTPGWVTSASPVGSPGPGTRLNTPDGTPASSISSVSRREVSTANSDGLSTTVQPVASAGATFWAKSMSGAFQGMTAATTPTGSRKLSIWTSPPVAAAS